MEFSLLISSTSGGWDILTGKKIIQVAGDYRKVGDVGGGGEEVYGNNTHTTHTQKAQDL